MCGGHCNTVLTISSRYARAFSSLPFFMGQNDGEQRKVIQERYLSTTKKSL